MPLPIHSHFNRRIVGSVMALRGLANSPPPHGLEGADRPIGHVREEPGVELERKQDEQHDHVEEVVHRRGGERPLVLARAILRAR